jgi:DNA-binding CsgD family transcriptional regulator
LCHDAHRTGAAELERDDGENPRSRTRRRADLQLAAHRGEPVSHVREPGARGSALRVEPGPVVAHLKREGVLAFAQHDADHGRAPQRQDPAAELTDREREVLRLVAAGKANKEIAAELVISERTARTHVSNILRKLGLASRTQAALWAVREGLADEP